MASPHVGSTPAPEVNDEAVVEKEEDKEEEGPDTHFKRKRNESSESTPRGG